MTTHIKGKVHFPRGIFRRFLHETALQDEAQSLLYGFFFSVMVMIWPVATRIFFFFFFFLHSTELQK